MTATLTLEDAARKMRDAVRDKSYQLTPLGLEVAGYLRAKKKTCSRNTMLAYESTLAAFSVHFADLELRDFEPPTGSDRLEEFLDFKYSRGAATSYNRHRAALKDFFDFQLLRQRMHGNPVALVAPAKKREVYRTTFSEDQVRAVLACAPTVRDRLALTLLFHYGLRREALRVIQFHHFDHHRKRLAVFLKGGKVRHMPIPESGFWFELERHILETEAEAGHYLMTARYRSRWVPLSAKGLHNWWYRMLTEAGITEPGQRRGERMHKARHTAGQIVLDRTGNLKAVQSQLMHEHISTTGDTYTDWDEQHLRETLRAVWEGE